MIKRSTWIALAAFGVILLAAVLWTRQRGDPADADITPTPEALWELDPTDVRSVSIEELESGIQVAVERDAEVGWVFVDRAQGAADAGVIERGVTSIELLRPRSSVQAVDVAEFGLDPARYRLTLALADGTSRALLIGREAPTGGLRYAQVPGSDEILVLSSFSLEDILGWVETPPLALPTLPLEPAATPG